MDMSKTKRYVVTQLSSSIMTNKTDRQKYEDVKWPMRFLIIDMRK